MVGRTSTERTGHSTQKPLPLYEGIIRASSNKGDIVLDPFCGCATTCVVAERLEREWVGIDLWDRSEEVLLDRMKKEGMIADGSLEEGDQLFIEPKDIVFTTEVPERTDDNQEAVPFLQARERGKEVDTCRDV